MGEDSNSLERGSIVSLLTHSYFSEEFTESFVGVGFVIMATIY